MATHTFGDKFEDFIRANVQHAVGIDATWARVAGPSYTAVDELLTGQGAYRAGGRWNAPESSHTVYLGVDPETATHEAMAHIRHFNIEPWGYMPKVIVGVRVMVDGVLDLTEPSIQAEMPMSMDDLLAVDWRAISARGDRPATHTIGQCAIDHGLKGMLVPSQAYRAGQNLVLYRDNFEKTDRLKVMEPRLVEKLGRRA